MTVTDSAASILGSVPCFAALATEPMTKLQQATYEVAYAKGEVIILEGEPCPGLFVVCSGTVKLYRSSPTGQEQIIRIVHRGACFECTPLLDQGPNPISASALEDSRVLLIPASTFKSITKADPVVLAGLLRVMAARIRSLLNMVEDFSFRQVYPRLAKLLFQLSERQGDRLVVSPSLPLNQQHLACILGCSRQMLNTSLRRLVREKTIATEDRRMIILDTERIRKVAGLGDQIK